MGNWYKTYLVALLCILGMTSIYSQDITRTTDPSQLLSGRISVFSVDTTSATVNSIAGIFRSFSGGSIDSIAVGDYFWASNKTKHYIASVDSVSDNIIYFKVAHKSGETASPGVGAILGYDRGYPTTPEGINSELKAAIESDFRNEIAYQTITQLDSLSHLLTYNGVLGELVQIKGGKIYKIESTGTPSEDKVILLNNSTYAVYQEPVTRFVLNGTNLEVAVGGDTSTVDLGGLSLSASPPIVGQSTEPTNQRVFWKDTDGDTTRVKAPYGNEGFKDLAYYSDVQGIINAQYQTKAVLDTIPIIAGIDQTRLDSMNVIGITSTSSGWAASTAARDTLYPDAFAFQIYNTDSLIIAYSGILVFPDSVFEAGKNYYQPYDYVKYQTTPDTILEQLVFKAVDTNKIEIRDRYSYLADGAVQSSREIPKFTFELSDFTDNTLAMLIAPTADYGTLSGNKFTSYTDPISGMSAQNLGTTNKRPGLVSAPPNSYFNIDSDGDSFAFSSGTSGLGEDFSMLVKFTHNNVTIGETYFIGTPNEGQHGLTKSSGAGFYRFYDALGSSTNMGGTITNGVTYIMVVNFNSATGVRLRYYNTSGTLLSTRTAPAYTGVSFNQVTLWARDTTSSPLKDTKVYGVYLFQGGLTDLEMNDLAANWDKYHKF